MIVFNPRIAQSTALMLEAALIGSFALVDLLQGELIVAAAVVMIPLLWRVAFVGVACAVSRIAFHTPEGTPLFSWPWLKLVVKGGIAIARNQIGMALPPALPAIPSAGTSPVVALIPGYSCNSGCFGTLPRRLAVHGLECVAFDPADPIGDLNVNAKDVVEWLRAITRLAPERPIILVGISMGGIIARLATAHPDSPRIAHMVTISSPHSGTWSAYFGLGAAAQQLRIGSPVLQNLASQQLTCTATAIWTPDDTLILPPISGKLLGAEAVAVAGYTHLAVAEAPAVEAAILRAATMPANARDQSIQTYQSKAD